MPIFLLTDSKGCMLTPYTILNRLNDIDLLKFN